MRLHVEQLFHEVADLSIETRARYFDQRRVDEATRRELEELLAFDSNTIPMLESDIGQIAERTLSGFEQNDLHCGPYQLGDVLGRGGMGAVYLGERVDGEVTQQVAVKLLRAGMDDPQLRMRFLAERQILAGLSHPNIARLLDAGHREDGQPYLVMEFVEGKPLDVYTERLSTRQKIALFLKVCGAVAYLHRNLVIHRDLKPANILVTSDGEPKLLDFGIAKIVDMTADSAATNLRILTPEYASPEQAMGFQVSTATDVYSLGAVLYRVLTGKSPRQFEGESVEQMARLISTGEVDPLSSADPALKGDLEFIVMKALRPEPLARYSTVDQFSEDLENYLEGRPIRARQDDTWYRMGKLLRRHWLSAAAAALVVGSLAGGLYIANRERAIAERRFGQLRQLSTKVIDLDGAIRTLPGSIEARQKLVAASLEYLGGLSRETAGDPGLAQEVADGYWRMARIQGVNAEFNLGDLAHAAENLKKADSLIESVLAARPGNRNALFRSALIAHDRMILADTDGRRDEAVAFAHAASDRLEAFTSVKESGDPVHVEGFLRPGNARESELSGAALLYGNIALGFVNRHLYADGARAARRAVELVRTVPSAADVEAQALSVLANALRYQGDLESSLKTIREARALADKAKYPSETARFFSRYGLINREGLILGEEGAVNLDRRAEAIGLFRQALDMTEEAARKNPHDSASRGRVGTTAKQLGDLLTEQDPQGALAVFDLGIRRLGEVDKSGKTRRERAALLARSSYPLLRLGRRADAKERLDAARAILKDSGDYPAVKIQLGNETWTTVCALADFEAATGTPSSAVRTWEQFLDAVIAANPQALTDLRDAPNLSRMYETMAALYVRTGDRDKSAAMNARRLDLWSHWQRELPQNRFVRRQFEAARQFSSGRSGVKNQS